MKKQDNKGITLITLVITVVVLTILAGVSINAVVGDDGIIAKARENANTTKETSTKEKLNRLILEYQLAKTDESLENFLKTKIPSKIDKVTNNGDGTLTIEKDGVTVTVNATQTSNPSTSTKPTKPDEPSSPYMNKNTEVTYQDGTLWIPEGFKIADDSASTVQGGVVIEDKDGNQFVWVPVDSISDYKRTWYTGEGSFSSYSESLADDEKTSVTTYKGFYIGRYEAGDKENTEAKQMRSSSDITKTVTIKEGQAPYNYVTKTQAISLAENFATKQGYKATTKLVSSYAWDTTIAFIQKVVKDYGNSSPQGNYFDTSFPYTDITGKYQNKANKDNLLIPTGQTTPVCNFYDIGGNIYEWTTESCSSTYGIYNSYRGGKYNNGYAQIPAGYRFNGAVYGESFMGFRITLFM